MPARLMPARLMPALCTAGVRAVYSPWTPVTAKSPAIAGSGRDAPPVPLRRNARSRCAAVLGLTLAATPAAADPFEDFGTAMKYGLPLAAAACAADQHRLEDFAVRGVLQAALVWGMKQYFDGTPIARRPNGEGEGFPSGHTAAAFFGAADLAGKCFPDNALAGAASYGAAGLTGWSRVHAGAHTPEQVFSGALIGFSLGAASFGIGTDEVSFSIGMKF